MPAARTLRVKDAPYSKRGAASARSPVSNWLQTLVVMPGGAAAHWRRHLWLPERERVRLGAGLEERDFQRPLAHHVVLTDQLVQPAVPKHAVPVLVDVHAS
jgi:hypothetical protein